MASHKPYECYVCQRNGFNGVMVFLAGKDENNKTIYLEEDGSKHAHKTQQHQMQQQAQGSSTTVVTEPTATKILNAKLDRIVSLLEERLPHSKTE